MCKENIADRRGCVVSVVVITFLHINNRTNIENKKKKKNRIKRNTVYM